MLTEQTSLSFAKVAGKEVKELPNDLFIPPEALEVFLEAFEGPLDLLLYLIRKQKFDVVDLPIHQITKQYLEYIELLSDAKVELAADYLVMAATLAEIKSRLLLPKMVSEQEDEEDPRAVLIRQLKAYESIKHAALELDELPRLGRDLFVARAATNKSLKPVIVPPEVSLADIGMAFAQVLKRIEANEHHHVQKEALSTRERMSQIMALLSQKENRQGFVAFEVLFDVREGRAGVVVTFLALMELVKELLVELTQAEPLRNIYVKAC